MPQTLRVSTSPPIAFKCHESLNIFSKTFHEASIVIKAGNCVVRSSLVGG